MFRRMTSYNGPRPNRRWGTTTDGDNRLGMGPGIALVDATLSGDVNQVQLLRDYFGNQSLATAAAIVTQRAIGLREDFDDELVMELTHVHLGSWANYDEFIIRRHDAFHAASAAIHSARRQILGSLRHHMRAALASNDTDMPPVYRPNKLLTGRSITSTFGLAYGTTLTFVHMATSWGYDPEEVLRVYRASTAAAYAHPAEGPPLA